MYLSLRQRDIGAEAPAVSPASLVRAHAELTRRRRSYRLTLRFITNCLSLVLDATTAVAWTTTLKNVVYLHSQRSAITVRASCTWWLTAPIKLSRSSPLVLREDTKLNRSLPPLLSREKGEERTATRLRRTLRRAGWRSQSAQAGHHRRLRQVSCLRRLKNQTGRGLLFRKGKKLKAFVITYQFLYPLGMSTSCKYRGNNFHYQ